MLSKSIHLFNKYTLEIIVFVVGAVVMILELVGSRILAPYLGTSIFVWTSLIGVVLGSLSLGYWQGGKIADKNPSYKTFSMIILAAAIFVGLDAFLKSILLALVYDYAGDIRFEAIVAAILLFAPASILLGMVSPYAAKLRIIDLKKTGSTIGNLYAISTIGSITGTFLAGFFLISYFSNTNLLFILSATLLAASLASYGKYSIRLKAGFILFLIFIFSAANSLDKAYAKEGLIDIDTAYNKVWIYPSVDKKTNKQIRLLALNNESNSAIFLNENGENLVFDYTKFYRLAKHFNPNLKNSLMIGGGAYSYPQDYLKKFPDAKMDVVEIDPKLTEISKEYFRLKDDPRLTIYHEDGRIFLNKTKNKYDVVFGDAFKSMYSIPYQLTTREATQKIYDSLNDNGVVIINVISAVEGKKSKFLQAEYKTYKDIFPQVYVFPVDDSRDSEIVQNIMLVALKSKDTPSFNNPDYELDKMLQYRWTKEIKTDLPVLTDDYAPVDQYMMSII